jgi:hypothetical protein
MNRWMQESMKVLAAVAAMLVGSSAAYAGSCPQGTVEVCPLYELGEQGPCQCKTPGKIKGSPQTIVNNTGSITPPSDDRPKTIGTQRPQRPTGPGAIKAASRNPHEKYWCGTDQIGPVCKCSGVIDCVAMDKAGKCDKNGMSCDSENNCSCVQ